jgi:integrase
MVDVELQSDIEVHFSDFDRLRLNKLLFKCGYFQLAGHKRARLFEVLSRGCRLLANGSIANAHEWESCFKSLAKAQWPNQPEIDKSFINRDLSELTELLIDQPSTSFSTVEQEDCLAFGTKLFLCVSAETSCLNAPVLHGVRQLFKSNNKTWGIARRSNLLQKNDSELSTGGSGSMVVDQFLENLKKLVGFEVPKLENYLGKAATKRTDSETAAASPVPTPEEDASNHHTPEQPDDSSPDPNLFEAQILRGTHPDLNDGHRLPFKWGSLNNAELAATLARLRTQLRAAGAGNRAVRTHAAARITSLFCGLSLRTCLRLPIHGRGGVRNRGTMHLDLIRGVLRRDVLCIAPRMDREDRRQVQGRWWRAYLPPEVIVILLEIWDSNPSCKTLGDLLATVELTHTKCQHLLNDGWPSSHRPEDTRFATSLSPCLLELGVHPALVARATGNTNWTPPADHYYLTLEEHTVHEAIQRFCIWAQLTPPPQPLKNRVIGSPKTLTKQQINSFMRELNQRLLQARNSITTRSSIEEVIDFHNLYTVAVVLQMLWALGARGTRIPRLTYERIFGSDEYLAISDRQADRYSRQRICPSTEPLLLTRVSYLEHLRSMSKRLRNHLPAEPDELKRLASGLMPHRSPFHIFEATLAGWVRRELNRKDLVVLLTDLGDKAGLRLTSNDLNASRHFWHTELVTQGVAQVAIEALLGHHFVGAEAFGYGSGVAVRNVCDYLRPILTNVHRELDIRPLIGLGRQAERFRSLPTLAVPKNLRVLPQVLLKQKMSQDDLIIQDSLIREQDPPSTSKTPLSHSAMTRLHSAYQSSSAVRQYRHGAALFGLVCFDMTLSKPEQGTLYESGMGDGISRIGRMCVLEASQNGHPVAQRILTQRTQLAFFLARSAASSVGQKGRLSFVEACDELHSLLRHLDPKWPANDGAASLRLLALLASHWAAIEIAPGSLFGVFHKGPFIPVADLARLYFDRPRIADINLAGPGPVVRRMRSGSFTAPMEIVKKWADKDKPHGESLTRAAGCTKELARHLIRPNLDLSEQLFTKLLIADLSDTPPYKKLDIATLKAYAEKYRKFFQIVRDEDSADLESQDFLAAFTDMGGDGDILVSAPPRWALLHIAAFLARHGHWVPQGLAGSPATKASRAARIPVYASALEVKRAATDMAIEFANLGGTYSFSATRLRLQRSVPLRRGEVRYLRPQDLDCSNQLLHVTSSGHNHLKSESSRGSIPIPISLAQELALLKERRTAIYAGTAALMFADAHVDWPYASFDQTSDVMQASLASRTGCPTLREHDLRAAAITDLCFDVTSAIECLGQGCRPRSLPVAASADELTGEFSRFVLASRYARHASILTTLRYYNCGGMLDLHTQIERALFQIPWVGIHVSSILGVSCQSLYAAAHRRRKAHLAEFKDANALQFKIDQYLSENLDSIPTPTLQGPQTQTLPALDAAHKKSSRRHLFHACLLSASGREASVAADAMHLPEQQVTSAISKVHQYLAARGVTAISRDLHSPFQSQLLGTSEPSNFDTVLDSLSFWLCSNPGVLTRCALPLGLSIHRSSSTLSVCTADHLKDLLPLLASFPALGIRVAFRPAKGILISQHATLGAELEQASIVLHPARSQASQFGLISFSLPGVTPIEKVSPRSVGALGRIVLTGLLVGLTTQ